MHVHVLHFAILRERAGCGEQRVPIALGTTVGQLYKALFPELDDGAFSVMFAVNQVYVAGDHLLADGDEVAFIPPLGGG